MAHYDIVCRTPCEDAEIVLYRISQEEYDSENLPACEKCGGRMRRVWNGHIPVNLKPPQHGRGRQGTPWYGGPEARERRMDAARRKANKEGKYS